MNILTFEDFRGRFSLPEPNEYREADAKAVIGEYEKIFLVDILGIELYNDFKQDFETGFGVPAQDRWLKFLNGEIYEPSTNYKVEYEGCKSFLVPLTYAMLVGNPEQMSDVGFVIPLTDGAEKINPLYNQNKSDQAYNYGLKKRKECYCYLLNNDEVYTDFELYFKDYKMKGSLIIRDSL